MSKKPDPKKQEAVLHLALAGHSVAHICSTVGISPATYYRWRNDPAFDEQFRNLQTEGLDTVQARLINSTSMALDTLRTIMESDTKIDDAMAKVQAARLVFEISGYHKNNPLLRSDLVRDVETEDDVVAVLESVPDDLLQRALASRAQKERNL